MNVVSLKQFRSGRMRNKGESFPADEYHDEAGG